MTSYHRTYARKLPDWLLVSALWLLGLTASTKVRVVKLVNVRTCTVIHYGWSQHHSYMYIHIHRTPPRGTKESGQVDRTSTSESAQASSKTWWCPKKEAWRKKVRSLRVYHCYRHAHVHARAEPDMLYNAVSFKCGSLNCIIQNVYIMWSAELSAITMWL